ncbi:MAG: sigma-70 family RNA polymerase sigma factor, partial [Dehalococcoidia bacterium]|nr:sigma-70 family RNA polymerase sigma factor [Dehalococcoidia bacterium]
LSGVILGSSRRVLPWSSLIAGLEVHREEELVRRAQRREPEAFGQLYEAHFDRIYRYVMLRVRNQADAEDITQQVFLKALEKIGSYRWRGMPFSSWLFRIAHNLVVDYWKKKGRETVRALAPEEIDDIAVSASDPVAEAELQFDVNQLMAACEQLTEAQREIISLRFAGGLSVKESAKVMGRSEGAVKVLQHAALAKLRRILCPAGEGADV